MDRHQWQRRLRPDRALHRCERQRPLGRCPGQGECGNRRAGRDLYADLYQRAADRHGRRPGVPVAADILDPRGRAQRTLPELRGPPMTGINGRIGRRGIAAVEFAILMPVLILLLVGMVDVTRYVSAALKLERVTSGTADVGTQYKSLRDGMTVVNGDEVGILFLAAQQIAKPLDLARYGAVVI